MDTLDSRILRYTDCFAQKFTTLGTIRYWITSPAGHYLPEEQDSTFVVEVKAGGGARGQQHNVVVTYKDRHFIADPSKLEIVAGDCVLWHTPDTSAPGFIVFGEGETVAFNSSAITTEALYTHAFGLPGEYRWADANGGPAKGIVKVTLPKPIGAESPKEIRKNFLKTLSQPTVIRIRDDRVEPDNVQVTVGQTVFWAVERSSGLAIADIHLIKR